MVSRAPAIERDLISRVMALGFTWKQPEKIVNLMEEGEKIRALTDDKFLHDFTTRHKNG